MSLSVKSLFVFPVVLAVALAQEPFPHPPAAGAAAAPNSSTSGDLVLKATTRLIQVNVIVRDRQGNAVRDLKKEDFQVLDNGKPQQISVFSMDSSTVLPQVKPLPDNVFTNTLQQKSAVPSSVTVILIDNINTHWQDQAWAKQQLIKYLKTIHPEDRVAIYALGPGLRVLHDFTTDSAGLLAQLERYKGALIPEADKGETSFANDLSAVQFDSWMNGVGGATGQERDFYMVNKVEGTLHAIEFIANHLSSLPGRKNLIWLSGGFPLQIAMGEKAMFDPSRSPQTFNPQVEHAIKALNDANVAIYPVDSRGLVADTRFDASKRTVDLAPKLSMGPVVEHQQTMSVLASATGGHAYYNTNDLAKAIRDAVDDSALTYTVGFYPSNETFDGKFHKVEVKTPGHGGLNIRYRKGYFDIADQPRDEKARKTELQDAVWSPLDSSALGLLVKVVSAGPEHPDSIDIYIRVDPHGVGITRNGDRSDGAVDVLLIQKNDQGKTFNGESDTVSLALKPETYAQIEKTGLLFRKIIPRIPQATQLRIIVRDESSGTLGSVTVPYSQLKL
jgi:VWFA-related protein